ncbi:hypothetical protein AB0C84_40205 [Actinomadura sp. NPDC048955]|uniref:hypothetical protein n=1 Tax=Actinomadura sp. NPDC048955 TaxID=3158228 RepID=UPI0033ED65E1
MEATTGAADPTEQAKAWLKAAHPSWSIVHSDQDRWWGFLDTRARTKDGSVARTTDVDADTAERLHELLTAAES